jgi:hypothetical protein
VFKTTLFRLTISLLPKLPQFGLLRARHIPREKVGDVPQMPA